MAAVVSQELAHQDGDRDAEADHGHKGQRIDVEGDITGGQIHRAQPPDEDDEDGRDDDRAVVGVCEDGDTGYDPQDAEDYFPAPVRPVRGKADQANNPTHEPVGPEEGDQDEECAIRIIQE